MIGPEALAMLCLPGAIVGLGLVILAEAIVLITSAHDKKLAQ